MGRDDIYPVRISKVCCLLHYVIAYLERRTSWMWSRTIKDVLFLCLLSCFDVLHEPRVFPELCNFRRLAHSRYKRHFHLLSRNPVKRKRKLFNLEVPVRTAQSSLAISVIKTQRRMLYRAKVAHCPDKSTKHTNTVWVECQCSNVKLLVHQVTSRL